MKIKHLLVENYERVTHADLLVRAPIVLLAGPNEAGKTSLADAIYHAVCGEARRVKLKKDFAALVHDGQKKGSVAITTADQIKADDADGDAEPGMFTLQIPADKRASNMEAHALMPLLLDPRLFPAMPADGQRKVVLSLAAQRVSAKAILQKLIDKGASAAKAKDVGAVLLAGFDAAAAEAKTKASEARGAWRAITGEAYGTKKAPDWKATKPHYDQQIIDSLVEALPGYEEAHHDAAMELGSITQRAEAHRRYLTRKGELQAVLDRKPRAQAKLDTDLELLAEWEPKVARAKAETGSGPQPLSCPHCGGLVDVVEGALHQHTPPGKEAAKFKALLPMYEESLAKATSFVEHDRAEIANIERAEAAIAELEKSAPTNPTAEEMRAAQELVASTKAVVDVTRTNLRAAQDAKALAERADSDTTKALTHHKDVEEWEAIADWLSPAGIPSEMMEATLKPLNGRMAATAAATGWPTVAIDKDMNIHIGARVYSLASKSAQWRAQVTIAEAMAHVSGVKTFMCDEVDILDSNNRMLFLRWLHSIAGELDTVIAIGTFKQAPMCPPTFQVEWVQDGHAGAVDAEVRQAA